MQFLAHLNVVFYKESIYYDIASKHILPHIHSKLNNSDLMTSRTEMHYSSGKIWKLIIKNCLPLCHHSMPFNAWHNPQHYILWHNPQHYILWLWDSWWTIHTLLKQMYKKNIHSITAEVDQLYVPCPWPMPPTPSHTYIITRPKLSLDVTVPIRPYPSQVVPDRCTTRNRYSK